MDSEHNTSASELEPRCKPYRIDISSLYRCCVADAPAPDYCEHQLRFGGLEFCLHKSAAVGNEKFFSG